MCIINNIKNISIMACGTKKKKKMRLGGGISGKLKKSRLGGGISGKLKKSRLGGGISGKLKKG